MTNPLFKQTVGLKPRRNVFDLSHERKFSCNMGKLVPILCEDIIPGDTFRMNTEIMIRLAPMLAPIMHRVNVYTHFFFVPYRLIWEDWESFITGGVDGTEEPVFPYISTTNNSDQIAAGTLADYLGVASSTDTFGTAIKLNALPFRAYRKIYQDYYEDQTINNGTLDLDVSSGQDSTAYWNSLLDRHWEKDYFTSALPFTQRGGDVTLPLGETAPVYASDAVKAGTAGALSYMYDNTGNLLNSNLGYYLRGNAVSGEFEESQAGPVHLDPNGNMIADLSVATAATIEDLRRAVKLQQWLERNARGGSRYTEQIFAHFGVRSSDHRLQRPEYLGGGKSPVVISEVLQTSATETETPQANMAGHGISIGNTHRFKKFFEEHGIVMGIMSVLPKTTYQQGHRRLMLKNDKFDFYFPEFAQLGEQAVWTGELYSQFVDASDKETFGYQSRYSEYKYIPSTVHGDFKESLSYWHMGRIFDSLPTLNATFVRADPTHRIFAVETETIPKLYVQIYNDLKAIRPIPVFNNPNLL